MSNEVATRQQAGALATVDFGEFAGAGFDNVAASDKKIPFINALQAKSEAVEADGSDLRPGMLYNTVTGEAFDGKKGIIVIPAFIEHCYARFQTEPRKFIGRLAVNDPIIVAAKARKAALGLPFGKLFAAYDDAGREVGDQLVETRYVYSVLCDETGMYPVGFAIIAFKSTDTDEFKRYFATALADYREPKASGGVQPTPLFAHPTRITTQSTPHPKGSSYNFVCAPAFAAGTRENMIRDMSDPRFVEGMNLCKLVKEGLVKADFSGEAAAKSDDIPF